MSGGWGCHWWRLAADTRHPDSWDMSESNLSLPDDPAGSGVVHPGLQLK
jgi:hypothetical protein